MLEMMMPLVGDPVGELVGISKIRRTPGDCLPVLVVLLDVHSVL